MAMARSGPATEAFCLPKSTAITVPRTRSPAVAQTEKRTVLREGAPDRLVPEQLRVIFQACEGAPVQRSADVVVEKAHEDAVAEWNQHDGYDDHERRHEQEHRQ